MEEPNSENGKMTRKRFLRALGSIGAGCVIAGGAGNLAYKMFAKPDELFYQTNEKAGESPQRSAFASPYRKVASFKTPEQIESFELYQSTIVVASTNSVYLYDENGKLKHQFRTNGEVMDITVCDDLIYVLYPMHVDVFNMQGTKINEWDACDENADYCSLTVFGNNVFITDAQNKLMCKYLTDGTFVKFIQSPNGFVVPSYSFGVMNMNGTVYCSNPGRHTIESYSVDGDFLASFGEAGVKEGRFSGCCNPVYLTSNLVGEIITSEKGIPRISCYSPDGEFRSVLLDEKTLGGGNAAYEVRVNNDRLIVANKNQVTTFQYDPSLVALNGTALSGKCATCGIDCPLRVGVTI